MTPVNFISQVRNKSHLTPYILKEWFSGRRPHGSVPWIQLPLSDRDGLLVHLQNGQKWNTKSNWYLKEVRCVHFKQQTNCPVFPRIRFGNWKRFGSRSSNSAHHAFSRQICSAWPTLLITKGQKPTSQIENKLLVNMKVTIIKLADIISLIDKFHANGRDFYEVCLHWVSTPSPT